MWADRFGKLALDEITAAMLEQVRAERLQSVQPATVNRELGFLKHLYNMAIRDEKILVNPVAKLHSLREPSGRVRYLSPEEEARLIAATSKQDWDRIELALHTGLRKGEFLALEWTHVDPKTGLLTIPRTKNGCMRHIPMTSVVRDILRRLPRQLHSSLVFPNNLGRPDYRWVEKTFPRLIQAAQIENFHFHDLRHTFASRLAMAGVDLLTIMQLGGWKSLTMF
jgi:integrase